MLISAPQRLTLSDRPLRALDQDRLISAQGVLSLGTETDKATGLVSRVRLRFSRYSESLNNPTTRPVTFQPPELAIEDLLVHAVPCG